MSYNISQNRFSLFQSSVLSEKPKHKHIEEDEFTVREFEESVLIRITQKPPPPPPPLPPQKSASLFMNMEILENTAKNMLSGLMTSDQIGSLPVDIKNFVSLNPGFIRNLMNGHGVISQELFSLSLNQLMFLHKYRENLEKLLDSGISMQKLLSLDDTARSLFIYNADAIVSLMKLGSTFEKLSQLSNNDLMSCVNENRASEAASSPASASGGPS